MSRSGLNSLADQEYGEENVLSLEEMRWRFQRNLVHLYPEVLLKTQCPRWERLLGGGDYALGDMVFFSEPNRPLVAYLVLNTTSDRLALRPHPLQPLSPGFFTSSQSSPQTVSRFQDQVDSFSKGPGLMLSVYLFALLKDMNFRFPRKIGLERYDHEPVWNLGVALRTFFSTVAINPFSFEDFSRELRDIRFRFEQQRYILPKNFHALIQEMQFLLKAWEVDLKNQAQGAQIIPFPPQARLRLPQWLKT